MAVKLCIEENGEIPFRNMTGLTVEGFLGLLTYCLGSTLLSFEGEMFVQRCGICIGSRVALVLCDVFLASCDKAIAEKLEHRERVNT